MNIVIRADGGETIGFGHIMRCAAIGSGFKNRGDKVVFIVNNSEGVIRKVEQFGFEIVVLENELSVGEVSEFHNIMNATNADVLVVDSYNVTPQYFSQVKRIARNVVYIDDLNMFPYDVDMVINGNAYAEELLYTSLNSSVVFLLGSKYTMLRDEFIQNNPVGIRRNVERVLITVGGSDLWSLTSILLDCFGEMGLLDKIKLDVVIGPAFKYIKKITDKYGNTKNIQLHTNVESMSTLMSTSDMAITAGGTTVYETAFLGVPSIVITTADNQFRLATKMNALGAVDYLGYVNDLTKGEIIDGIEKLINDYSYRKLLSENARRVVDGKGLTRCVEEIAKLAKK